MCPPFFFLMPRRPPQSPLFPYTTLFRSVRGRAPLGAVRLRVVLPVADRRAAPGVSPAGLASWPRDHSGGACRDRSEEHTSELQSQFHLVCRLLLEKKKKLELPQHDRA